MTTKKLGTIDLETGEILEGIPVYVKAKVKWSERMVYGNTRSVFKTSKRQRN